MSPTVLRKSRCFLIAHGRFRARSRYRVAALGLQAPISLTAKSLIFPGRRGQSGVAAWAGRYCHSKTGRRLSKSQQNTGSWRGLGALLWGTPAAAPFAPASESPRQANTPAAKQPAQPIGFLPAGVRAIAPGAQPGSEPLAATATTCSAAHDMGHLCTLLLGSSITYRIAVGPQQGRNVITLQTLPACDEPFDDGVRKVAGFHSVHPCTSPLRVGLRPCESVILPICPCTLALRRARINAGSSNGCVGISAGRPSRKSACRSRRTATSGTS